MRILFLSHYFPPEVNAPASRTHEHCREWARRGHEVHVITGVPSHPAGVPFAGYRTGWHQTETVDGVAVHRVWTYLAPNRGIVRRTINYLSFVPTAVWRALRLGRFDVVVGTSPQFFCAVAAWLAAACRRTPWIFEVRDLWPASIQAVGADRRYMPLGLLGRLERHLYRSASAIVCLSPAFVRELRRRGVTPEKLCFGPNGIDIAFWRQGSREVGRKAMGVDLHRLVVSYVGTVGMAHDLDLVLDAAARMKHAGSDACFVIVGDGAELPRLRTRAEALGLTNVTFTGLIPRDQVPHYLAASDISLVTLRPSLLFTTVLPSKMFESMAAARPIVLAVDGEARTTLQMAEAGLAVAPGDVGALTAAIQTLAADPVQRGTMGDAGARFVAQEFSRSVWAGRYLQWLEELHHGQPGRALVGSKVSSRTGGEGHPETPAPLANTSGFRRHVG